MSYTHISDDLYITPNYSVIIPFYDGPPRMQNRTNKTKVNDPKQETPYQDNYKQNDLATVEASLNLLFPGHDHTDIYSKKNNVPKYDLSNGEKKRLRYACSMLQLMSKELTATNWQLKKKFKYNLAFITVTLPSINKSISDKEMKNVYFKNFLNVLRDKYNLRHYVWKAEAQENGNIHFHLTANIYIDYRVLLWEWNKCIRKTGFVSEFYNKYGHNDPNSTDVHSVRKVKNLGQYLIKYISGKKYQKEVVNGKKRYKRDENGNKIELKMRPIDGKLWNCSESLKFTRRLSISGVGTDNRHVRYIYDEFFSHIKKVQYCDLLFENLYSMPHKKNPELKFILNNHLYELDKMVIERNAIDQQLQIEKLGMIKILAHLKSKKNILKQKYKLLKT